MMTQSARAYWEARGYPQTSHVSGDCDCAAKPDVSDLEGLRAAGYTRLWLERVLERLGLPLNLL